MYKLAYALTLIFAFSNAIFAQFIPEEKPYRIALLGCIREYEPAPALWKYTEINADLALWVGDNIYADTEDDPSVIANGYQTLGNLEAFKAFKSQVLFLATWDDHDYGDNNENKHYALKKESKQLFREFWELEDKIPADQEGIYYSHYEVAHGAILQFIFLDVRYNRDEPEIDGEMLGESQWEWLEEELKVNADIRFIISGSQILLNKETGSETWDNYPSEKDRLFNLIKTTGAEGLVFLTGDQHYGEVARQNEALDYDAIELQFAGVNQIEDPEKNIYRVSSVASSRDSYAYIDVYPKDIETDKAHIQLSIIGINGQNEVSYRVNIDELKRNVNYLGQSRFKESTTLTAMHSFDHLDLRYAKTNAPTPASPKLEMQNDAGQLKINETSTYIFALFDEEGNRRSAFDTLHFEKLTPIPPVTHSNKKLTQGLHYKYKEGEYSQIPSFNEDIKKQGTISDLLIDEIAEQSDYFAIQFVGYISIPTSGAFTFSLRSDDGSNMYLHNKLFIENDGSHSARTRSNIVALDKGLHPIRIDYFEDYMGASLNLYWQLDDQPVEKVPASHYFIQVDN